MASIYGVMEESMKDSGKMENNKVKVFILKKMELQKLEYGTMVKI